MFVFTLETQDVGLFASHMCIRFIIGAVVIQTELQHLYLAMPNTPEHRALRVLSSEASLHGKPWNLLPECIMPLI